GGTALWARPVARTSGCRWARARRCGWRWPPPPTRCWRRSSSACVASNEFRKATFTKLHFMNVAFLKFEESGQAAFDRVAHQRRPAVQVQLAEHVLHVVLHGARGEHEAGGDLARGEPLDDQPHDVGLPLGERTLPLGGGPAE